MTRSSPRDFAGFWLFVSKFRQLANPPACAASGCPREERTEGWKRPAAGRHQRITTAAPAPRERGSGDRKAELSGRERRFSRAIGAKPGLDNRGISRSRSSTARPMAASGRGRFPPSLQGVPRFPSRPGIENGPRGHKHIFGFIKLTNRSTKKVDWLF